MGAGVGVWVWGAVLGAVGEVAVGVLPGEDDPADLRGVIVIVVPLLLGPPEALLMENRGGEGVDEEGDPADDDGEICSGGFAEFWALIVNDLTFC